MKDLFMKYNATIEFLSGQKAAILTLTDSNGEWSGAGRIDLPLGSKSGLYDLGYIYASKSAAAKGGTLETYKVVK